MRFKDLKNTLKLQTLIQKIKRLKLSKSRKKNYLNQIDGNYTTDETRLTKIVGMTSNYKVLTTDASIINNSNNVCKQM